MRQWVPAAARSENSDDLPKGFYGGKNRCFLSRISVAECRLARSDRAQHKVPFLTMIPGDTTEQHRSIGWDFLRRRGMTYALVLALVAATFLARSLVAPTLGSQSLYLFLMPAVLVAGIVGGLGPGLLVTILCLVLHLYVTGEYVNL